MKLTPLSWLGREKNILSRLVDLGRVIELPNPVNDITHIRVEVFQNEVTVQVYRDEWQECNSEEIIERLINSVKERQMRIAVQTIKIKYNGSKKINVCSFTAK